MPSTVLQQAAEFLHSVTYDSIDPDVIALSKRAIIDYMGCAIAGCSEPVTLNTFNWAQSKSTESAATVIGQDKNMSIDQAAMCNAIAGHALDFDDTSWTTIGHPTTIAAPVAFAVAEKHGLSGKDVLTGYAAGVEVGHKIAQLTMPQTSEKGWHTTCVYGGIIAAATQLAMLKPNLEIMTNALGIALSRASGLRSNFGTMTKPLHAGLAAMAGMEAVGLAMEGVTASAKAFEDTDGFTDCFARNIEVESVQFGKNWDLKEIGLAFKLYPCCSGSHPASDIMLELVNSEKVTADDIKSIDIGASLLGPRELVNHLPQTPLEARFSMEFALAAILLRKRLTLDEFIPEFVTSHEVQILMLKMIMDVDPELAKLGFIGTAPVKLTITKTDGEVINVSNYLAKGNPEKPLSDEEFRGKFMQIAVRNIPSQRAEQMVDALFKLETIIDIPSLLGCSTPQKTAA